MIFSEPLLFALALVDTGAILFLLIYFVSFLTIHLLEYKKLLFLNRSYQVITLSDLECDYLNAQQCCSRLNDWVLTKLIAHSFLTFFLLLHGNWILALLNFPMACWMVYELISVPKGNLGIYDPTEIHNRGQLKRHMRDAMIYLGYYLVFFFIYLYW